MGLSDDDSKMSHVLNSSIVRNSIEEAMGNWMQDLDCTDSDLREFLERGARAAAEKVFALSLPAPEFSQGWKNGFANEVVDGIDAVRMAEEAAPAATQLLKEKMGDSDKFTDLHLYSLMKIASYAGQVARMISHGLDPDLLRLTDEEANGEIKKLAQAAREGGHAVVIHVDPQEDTSEDILTEIRLRIDPPEIEDLIK